MTGGLAAPGLPFYVQIGGSPFADETLFEVAKMTLKEYGLGKDDTPDLLALSFSANDIVGHACGPQSVETRDILLRIDRILAALLTYLDLEVGPRRYVLILSSDHGIVPVPERLIPLRIAAGRGILTQRAAGLANRALVEAFGPAPVSLGRWVSAFDDSSLFLYRQALEAQGFEIARAAEIASLAAAEVQGISVAVPTEKILRGAVPDDRLHRDLASSVHRSRVGDVLFVTAPYWVDSLSPSSHGSPWNYDQEVPLLVVGPGVKKGHTSKAAVTPGAGVVIAAQLLGIPAPAMAIEGVPAGVLDP